jgi:hypothetical protein
LFEQQNFFHGQRRCIGRHRQKQTNDDDHYSHAPPFGQGLTEKNRFGYVP